MGACCVRPETQLSRALCLHAMSIDLMACSGRGGTFVTTVCAVQDFGLSARLGMSQVGSA